MAKPVIQFEQSAPYGLTNRRYGFQPAATNTPTTWTTGGTTLPPGLSLNTSTGLVSGTPSLRGDYSFGLLATNADGTSDMVIFTIRIDPSPPLPPPGFMGVTINFKDRSVTYDAGALPSLKSGDDWLQQITLKYGDAVMDAPLTSLKCRLKFIEDEGALAEGTSFVQVGTDEDAVYRHATLLQTSAINDALETAAGKMPKIKLKDLLTTEAGKRVVKLRALVEYELKFTNTGVGLVGRNPAIWTTVTSEVELVHELIPNL